MSKHLLRMENNSLSCLRQFEAPYKCDKCEKEYKRKSSLTRHFLTKHEPIEILKLKLKNETWCYIQMQLYTDQIKFLKIDFHPRAHTKITRKFYHSNVCNNKSRQ